MYGHHMYDTLNVMGPEKSGLPAPLWEIYLEANPITTDKKNRINDDPSE